MSNPTSNPSYATLQGDLNKDSSMITGLKGTINTDSTMMRTDDQDMISFDDKIQRQNQQYNDLHNAYGQVSDALTSLQTSINTNHDNKLKHVNQLRLSIEELNAINNTRKIQRSNFTKMNMTGYYIINLLTLIVLIGIIIFWAKATSKMSSGAQYKNINSAFIICIIIFIIVGFLLINAFWSNSVRDQMKKSNYLYQFPQF